MTWRGFLLNYKPGTFLFQRLTCQFTLEKSNGSFPRQFGHGFVVISETAEFLYKTTDYWYKEHERSVHWNDPELAIDWRYNGTIILADKDANAPYLKNADVFA